MNGVRSIRGRGGGGVGVLRCLVVSGSGKGVQNLMMGCNIEKSESNTFINTNTSSCLYQRYCLSSHFTIRYYFIFPHKGKSVLYFLHLLG